VQIALRFRPDWIVLDHYFLTQRWVDVVRDAVGARSLVLEDLEREWDRVDFILYGNSGRSVRLKESSEAIVLNGGRFALLSGDYRELRNSRLMPASHREQITIFAGGADIENLSTTFLRAVISSKVREWPVEVVVGSMFPHRNELEAVAGGIDWIRVGTIRPSMAATYARSRMALGAGGVSAWERACLGVPTVLVAVADNQEPVCRILGDSGAAEYIGSFGEIDDERIRRTVRRMSDDPALLDEMSSSGTRIVDGYGAKRIVQLVIPDSGQEVRLRDVRLDDADLLFTWFNEPSTRRNSNDRGTVEWSEHVAWLEQGVASQSRRHYLMELGGLPVGQIRFDESSGMNSLSYSIDKDFRARGLGSRIVDLGVRRLRETSPLPIRAVVRRENGPSLRIFQKLGFESDRDDELGNVVFMMR
jgi:spore coat polysaccharide biosynthesis predicted glycosyltransferase SpsG/RimJ/RimL family protein N-acetyltransferase